jgi:IclR family acetate operon transcriptional repressor
MGKPVNTSSTEQEPVKGPVDKAMEVLEALARAGGPQRLGEIARRTGLTKPTVHRHLRALAGCGFAQAAEGGAYRAGPRLLGLAAAALHTGPDLRLARPALADLRRRTGQLAHYAVRDGAQAVHLEMSEPAREYRMAVQPGDRTPLHTSAVGLAMLSALPPQEYRAVLADVLLDGGALPARTPRTLTAPDALRAALDESARLGYALDDEYDEPDVRSIAAPVLDAAGHPVGAIGVSGLTFSLDDESVTVFGPMVRAAARAVSAGLGRTAGHLGVVDRVGDGGRA